MAERLRLGLLLKIAKCWSVDEAAWVLDALKIAPKSLFWHRFWTDVDTIRVTEHGLACGVKVAFCGGPGGNQAYDGSFAMYVVDQILASGKNWGWLLNFNRDTTTHIKDQNLMSRHSSWEEAHDPNPSNCDDDEEVNGGLVTLKSFRLNEDERAAEFIEVNGSLVTLNSEGRQVS